LLATGTILRAEESWLLTTADFRIERVTLRNLNLDGAQIVSADGRPAQIPLDRILQFDRAVTPRAPAGKFMLALAGGDRLAGEPRGVDGERILWNGASLGELRVPLTSIVSMYRSDQPARPWAHGTEDVITLLNGDMVRGILSALSASTASIQASGGDTTDVPLDSVLSIDFASTAPPAVPSDRAFRITLADGSAATAASIELADTSLKLALADGSNRAVPTAEVASIEQLNGPVVWLSTLPPAQIIQTPLLGPEYVTRMNRSVTDKPIRFGDREFARGIGVHSYSRMEWDIDPAIRAFRTQYAIDGDLPQASVVVRIKLDDQVVHERTDFRAGTLSPVIVLDVAGQKRLTLEVDYGQQFDVQDRFNWIEPALLKQRPTQSSPAVPSTRPMG